MARKIIFRVLAGLVLLAAIAGIAYFAFTAGVASKVATTVQVPAVQEGARQALPFAYGMGMRGWHMFPFGFGCFVPLVVLFLLCLAFSAMRHLIWGPRHWGWRHMYRHGGPGGEDGPMGHHGPWNWKDEKFVPPMFNEWHKRAHETPTDKAPEESGK